MTRINLVELLIAENLVATRAEARRIICQRAVRLNGERAVSYVVDINPSDPSLHIWIGKTTERSAPMARVIEEGV